MNGSINRIGPNRQAAPSTRQPSRRGSATGTRGSTGFTLIELLTVIAIIALVAGMIVGLAPTASKSMRIKRVKGSLMQLATAIENFKAKHGYYPPDNRDPATQRNANPALNQLFYELAGTVFDPVAKVYRSPQTQSTIAPAALSRVFRTSGFVNSADNPKEVKSFLSNLSTNQIGRIQVGSDVVNVLVAPVSGPAGPLVPNPWRYVSSSPTNNATSFDLWAVVVIGRETNIISNWE